MPDMKALALGLLIASSSLVMSDALADEGARASAQVLFDDAMKLIDQKDFDHACPKLAEVVRLQPGKVGAMLELSRCYLGAGKIASAWARYRASADAAREAGDGRAAEADAKAAELAPHVPKVVIAVTTVTRGVPGLIVKRDDVEVGAAQWGTPLPVDAGKHSLSASAPGRRAWTTTLDVVEGAAMTIEVPALDDVSASEAAKPADMPPAQAVSTPTTGGAPAWAWVMGSVGIVSTGVGVGFLSASITGQSDITANCGRANPPRGYSTTDCLGKQTSNNTKQVIAGVFGGVGVLALGAAIVAIVVAPPRSTRPSATWIHPTPWFAATAAGLSIEGGFR